MRQTIDRDRKRERRPGESVIQYVRRVVSDRDASSSDLARAIVLAPRIENVILLAANSPQRGRLVPAATLEDAIIDLGLERVRRLVLRPPSRQLAL